MKGGVILNKEQLSAIRHDKGPMLVIAGAGTGKTTVIVERIKYLVESGLAKPSQILALTFTEKAAREMESRVDVSMVLLKCGFRLSILLEIGCCGKKH